LYEASYLLIRTPLILDPTKVHRENLQLLITCHPKVRLLFHVKVGVTEFLSLLDLSGGIALHEKNSVLRRKLVVAVLLSKFYVVLGETLELSLYGPSVIKIIKVLAVLPSFR
jgi:hypothetical protein